METEDFKAQALRVAAQIVSEHGHESYDQVVNLCALTYAMGARDGFWDANTAIAAAHGRLMGDLQRIMETL